MYQQSLIDYNKSTTLMQYINNRETCEKRRGSVKKYMSPLYILLNLSFL